jgi:hypothetical protein
MKFNIVGKTNHEIVEHALELVQEARELMNIVMDQIPSEQYVNSYYNSNEAGLMQAAGECGPYNMSLVQILEDIEGEI